MAKRRKSRYRKAKPGAKTAGHPAAGLYRTAPGEGWAVLRFDGGVSGNGRADAVGRWGFVLAFPGVTRSGAGAADGDPVTVNTCEWQGLYSGLSAGLWAAGAAVPGLLIEGDSRLVINQLTGRWASKAAHLVAWRERCLGRLAALGVPWHARWIPREANREADRLTRR